MRSPTTALMWEAWRVSRLELVLRVAITLVVGVLAMVASVLYAEKADVFATAALLFIIVVGAIPAASLKEFPFSLAFVRPVRTWVLVGVPMLFVSFSSALVYLIAVTVLNSLTDVAFPMMSAATLVALTALILAGSSWWSKSKSVRIATQYLVFGVALVLYKSLHPVNQPGNDFPPSQWASMFDFSLADYVLFGLIAVVTWRLTLFGVEVQRRGGGPRLIRHDSSGKAKIAFAPGWVNSLLPFVTPRGESFVRARCPTGSPLQAQVWFEAVTVGREVLSIALVTALAIPLGFALIAYFDLGSGYAMAVVFGAPVVPLLVAMGAVFPIHNSQIRASLSSFDTTIPLRTAPLVGLKVAFLVASVLMAVVGVYVSIWLSFDLVLGVDENFAGLRARLLDSYHAYPGTRLAIVGAFVVFLLTTLIAWLLAVRMFALLFLRRVVFVVLGALVYMNAFMFAKVSGVISAVVVEAHIWVIIVALILAMLAVYYKAWADRTMSVKDNVFAGMLSVVYVIVHVTFIAGLGEGKGPMGALDYLLLALAAIPVTAIALVPWSVDLLRHR